MKKALSILLSLVMLLTMLPTFAVTALAEDTFIERLEINYTTDNNNPSCSEGALYVELMDCLDNVGYSDGTNPNVAFGHNVYLFSYTGPDKTGSRTQVSPSSTKKLDPDLYYYLNLEIRANEGYDFEHEDNIFLRNYVEFIINGVKMTGVATKDYNEYWKLIDIFVPIELDLSNKVYSVSITNTDTNVEKGSTIQFDSDVQYYGADLDGVSWSLEGATSTETNIDSTGLLTVANDETATDITVKATSTGDSSIFATKTLTVMDKIGIDSVSLNITADNAFPDTIKDFYATVVGTDAHDVVWELDGNNSAGTTIAPSDKFCRLTIARDETATTLTVKVTSVKDSTKFATATITVVPTSFIDSLNINYTTNNAIVGANESDLYNEVYGCLYRASITNGSNVNVASGHNVYLLSFTGPNMTGTRTQISHSTTNKVDANLNYYLFIELTAKNGYDFKHTGGTFDTESVTFVVNGIETNGIADETYNDYWKLIDVYIPIEVKCNHNYTKYVSDSNATCTSNCTETAACDNGCGEKATREIENSKLDHSYITVVSNQVDANCTENGKTAVMQCANCTAIIGGEVIPATGHNFGDNFPSCVVCAAANPSYVAPQPEPAPVPTPTPAPAKVTSIKVNGETIKKDKNGEYVSKKATKPVISKLSKASKSFKITWKKVKNVSGYQIQYSTSSKFTAKTSKKVTYSGNKSFTKTVKKLKGNKKYYVRVRTYTNKKVNGKTVKIYSGWSKVKNVTTKK